MHRRSNPAGRATLGAAAILLIMQYAYGAASVDTVATRVGTPGSRPRIGLVLSGGGARGAAHVGVLKVLEELRVPVDAIAGTSMGAVVGGLYASGMSADDIEQLLASVNWQDAFQDRPPRAELNFRRKQDDRNFLVRYALGVNKDGVELPAGFIQGQKLAQTLRRETLPVAQIRDFDRLPIPFRAIATDFETGEPVVISAGDLVTAMRASMSAPGVFTPVERGGELLVDGGLVLNLPVEVARAMNVDVIIAVDVSFPLQDRDAIVSPLTATNQMVAIMIRNRTREQRALLGPADVLIEPQLGRLTSVDFSRVPQTIAAGARAAERRSVTLAALGVDEATYRSYRAGRLAREAPSPVVEFVRTDWNSGRYAPLVEANLGDLVGRPLDSEAVSEHLSQLYALDLFETIDYEVIEDDGRTGIELSLKRKSWGPNYVRVGLNIQDDFEGNSRYNAAARFIMTELNSLGAEWLTDLQIGENPKIFSEFYQPLSLRNPFFIAPRVDFEIRNLRVIEQERAIAEYRVRSLEAGLDVGREISNWGEVRLGARRGSGQSRVRVGDPLLPSNDFERGGGFFRFSYDKVDSVYFPRKGQQFTLEWTAERASFGADLDLDLVNVDWLIARSIDRHTFIFWTDIGSTVGGDAQPQDYYTLGGFFNLSGLPPGALAGPHYGIGRLIYYRKIGRGGEGVLDLPAYLGVSFEAGNVWQDRHDASFGDLEMDGSLFLGVDTPLGPLYLATGYHSGGGTAFYLFLGRTF
jgi:NTE family protein